MPVSIVTTCEPKRWRKEKTTSHRHAGRQALSHTTTSPRTQTPAEPHPCLPANVASHYDSSNEMFVAFLSPDMTYSCVIFPLSLAHAPAISTTGGIRSSTVHQAPPADHLSQDQAHGRHSRNRHRLGKFCHGGCCASWMSGQLPNTIRRVEDPRGEADCGGWYGGQN